MRSPIKWIGGKARLAKKIMLLIPKHKLYVEVFGGGAALLFAKKASPIEIYNDLDSGLVDLFRVLRDKKQFREFKRLVEATPYSREEYNLCRETWRQCKRGSVIRAYRFFIVARMSFGGWFAESWGYSKKGSEAKGFRSAGQRLPEIHERLAGVQIECLDFRKLIKNLDGPDTFFYLDPPYIPATRSIHSRNSRHWIEMTQQDHKDLVAILLEIKGQAILSGYRHPLLRPLEKAGWARKDFKSVCQAVAKTQHMPFHQGEGALKKKQPRIETIWIKAKRRRRS